MRPRLRLKPKNLSLDMMKKSPRVSRRHFLKSAGAAGSAIAFPAVIPASALGKGGRPAPSERITMAAIGFGTIAHATAISFLGDKRVQTVAVCDVNKRGDHYGYRGEKEGGREYGCQRVNEHYGDQDCKAYEDYREVFARDDIDAVNISTPDHWHGIMAVEGAKAGKHIYGQKPLSLNVAQGRAMSDAVKEAGITWQTGSQQRSSVHFRRGCELVRNGYIGKVKTVKVVLPGGHNDWNQMADQKEPAKVPEGLNWDLWQGPAPERKFRPALHPLNWRHNYDYSGGMVTDFGAHHIDIAHWGLGRDESGPVRFFNPKVILPPADDLYNTATSFHFECEYDDGILMVVESADISNGVGGVTFEGEDGKWVQVGRGVLKASSEELRRTKIGPNDTPLYESKQHEKNFIDCIYSGEPTAAPIEVAHRSISVAHIANILFRLGRDELKWDPETERFANDEAANAALSRKMRAPWKI